MMRKLAVVADYLNDSHRAHIEKMAGDAGFTVDYFTEGHLPQDRAGEYEVIYGTVPPKELKAATALRWFCCAYAGMDQWKDDALYHSPEVMLSNSSGAYGVTISEHMVMVTLMLLRQMPTVQEWMHRHDWSNEKPPMRSVCGAASRCWVPVTSARPLPPGEGHGGQDRGRCLPQRPPCGRCPTTPCTPRRSWIRCCRRRKFWPWPCPARRRQRASSPAAASPCCPRRRWW